MICHKCGGILKEAITDRPFKVGQSSVVIIKKMPVFQCQNCYEYLIEDDVLKKVDQILDKVDKDAELEILNYAA